MQDDQNDILGCHSVLEPSLNHVELRSAAIADFMPIHYYLFSSTGRLLFANRKASTKLLSLGKTAHLASRHGCWAHVLEALTAYLSCKSVS